MTAAESAGPAVPLETFGLPECTPRLIAKLRNMPPELLALIRPNISHGQHQENR